ncbi:MAG: 5'-nucleotidase SurE [Chlamydiales bacterium]|nr:5'-nucleotidase SurE [Chlamydiales bacterium]
MRNRPRIILTNDDGIHAPGIKSLWKALHDADCADLFVIAPATEKSGTGVSITWDRPMLIQESPWPEETPAWSVDGTPADCVKMADRIIMTLKPDLIVSGINAGSNAGRNVLHSGTVGAVIEGVLRGIPGLALSCENGKEPNFHVAEKYAAQLVEYVLAHPLPVGTFLNVNFPQAAQEYVKGFRMTRQGRGRWAEDPYLHIETEHGPTYWLGGKPEELVEDDNSDISLLREGYMTAVPIHVHELTDRQELLKRQNAFESYFIENGVLN